MPLWMSSGPYFLWRFGWWGDESVELTGDVALEAADGFSAGIALGEASGEVGAGRSVPAQAGYHDGVQGAVGTPVTTTVESAAAGLARGSLDRADAAQSGEGCLAVQTLGVVAGRDE